MRIGTHRNDAAAPDDEYTGHLRLRAPRERVFDAVGTVRGVRGWWTPIVSGSASAGGELHLGFEGLDETIVVRVEDATRPASVRWSCVEHTSRPEWNGTTVSFELVEREPEATELEVRHGGIARGLVEPGWERFLRSLAASVERGAGTPFRDEPHAAPLAVARAYRRAWTEKDFAAAGRYLAPDLETDVPSTRTRTRASSSRR